MISFLTKGLLNTMFCSIQTCDLKIIYSPVNKYNFNYTPSQNMNIIN